MDFNSLTLTSFGSKKSDLTQTKCSPIPKLPKIVLRNSMGYPLKTNTSFQRAIYDAKNKLLEPNRRLTELEWRLPHAPCPSRPDYSRSLEYDDFRSLKRSPKPMDNNKIEHWDMSFWNYLLPDLRLDRSTVDLETLEKYYKTKEVVPHPEFIDAFNFRSLKNVQNLVLPIVSSRFSIDKLIPGLKDMDYRQKMLLTQVLSTLLTDGFASLEDLPANVRNDVLLKLAELASEGKLSAEMQEKLFAELAQNLASLPPELRAKITEQLIKSMDSLPPEVREQVIQQLLSTIDTLPEEERQKVLHDLVKNLASMPEEARHQLINKLMENMNDLEPESRIRLLQELLRDADGLTPAMRDNILQNLLDSLDTLPPEERERVLAELTKNLANLPPSIRQQLIDKLLEKSEELPPEIRDQMYAELLKNVTDMPDEMKRKLVVELLKNVDNMPTSIRQQVMKEILNNLELIDGTMHGQVLQDFLKSLADLPEDERDELMKKIIEKTATLDDPEIKRQLLEEILKNPENLSASALQELVKNVGELPPDLQKKLYQELLNKKDDLSPSVLEEIIRNSANVPQEVLMELLKSVDKLAPSTLAELAKHLNVLPDEVRSKLFSEMMMSMDNLDDEQKAALLGELLKNQNNLNEQQMAQLMKNLDQLDPALKEKVLQNLLDNVDTLPPSVKEKLLNDLLNNQTDMDQETRVKLLTKLLENPGNLTEAEREKVYNELMKEIENVKDPELKKKMINDMIQNLKDIPPEAVQQLLSNINDLPPGQQKELLKQILEKFDQLPPEMKEKLVDDLLKSAAGLPPDVQTQIINDLLKEMKDLPIEERTKLMQKVLDNPNLDPTVRAKLMEEMLKTMSDLPPEERQKLIELMLENSDNLDPKTKAKLMEEMLKTMSDLPPEERQKLLEKMLENNGENMDPKIKAKLMDEMLKLDLPPEERQKLLEKMLENSANIDPKLKEKLMNEMVKNLNELPPEQREKFLASLVSDPDKKHLLKELINNGQLNADMKTQLLKEITKNLDTNPLNTSTLVDLLKQSKELPPDVIEKVLKSVENMSAKELNELAKNLDHLPPDMKERVMKEIMKNLKNLDPKAQATILQQMLNNTDNLDPKVLEEIMRNVANLTPTAIKELLRKADKLPPDALKELLKHVDQIPVSVLEELIKNADQLAPEVIAALLASKDLPPAIREKLLKEINKNKKLKEKLKSLDPLTQGVQGVGKVQPKAKPDAKKPKLDVPKPKTGSEKKIRDLYEKLFGKDVTGRLDMDMDFLAGIDESELEDIFQDPEFLNMDPNLSPEARKKLIEEIRKKRSKRRIADVPPLSKEKLQDIEDPLDYLYKYCIIHPDRMAVYERVFLNTIKKQKPLFEGMNPPEHTVKLINTKRGGEGWSNVGGGNYVNDPKQYHALDSSDDDDDDKPIQLISKQGHSYVNFEKEMNDGSYGDEVKPMNSVTSQKLQKIDFILNDLKGKEYEIIANLQTTSDDLTKMTGGIIMDMYPQTLDPEYDPKKKKQKTSEKTIGELKSYGAMYTTDQMLDRLNKNQRQMVDGQTEIKQLNGQISWSKNKLVQLRMRIEMLLGEREGLIARDAEEHQQAMYKYKRVEKFRRQQSPLWNALHPSIDYEMNVEELEKALRQINGNLISEKECQYIKFILKIPGVKRVNLKLFSLIAALSEKVTQIEPFVRKLINKFDFEALDIKMLKAKELFYLMADKSQKLTPKGYVPIQSLCVELAAGGVERDNIENCKKKFDREGKNYVDFLDWLTYVPLFVEIHSRICSNPFFRYEDPLKAPPKETTDK